MLSGLFLLTLAPRSSPRPHSDMEASLGPPTRTTLAGQTPRPGALHPRDPLPPARAASSPASPRLGDQWEGCDAGTRPAIGWLRRGERWCGARSPPGCELWAVVRATVRDVGRQAEQLPGDWLDDRTILAYWRPPGGSERA